MKRAKNAAQYRTVCRLLSPCPKDHRKDDDWETNHSKQYCRAMGCYRTLCEWCATRIERPKATVVTRPTYRHLWCDEHA